MIVYGLNPVREAIRAHADRIRYVAVTSTDKSRLTKLIAEAKAAGLTIRVMPPDKLRKLAGSKAHNGVAADVGDVAYVDVDTILGGDEPPERIFILDGVQDPQNLGAILRVADGFGFGLVIIPKHEATGLTAVAVKASAGAAEWVPVAQVTNLARTIEDLKEAGYWIYAADAGGQPISTVDLSGKVVMVMGSEGRGVRRNVLDHCDLVVSIPMRGEVSSLNVATAAAVLAWEVVAIREK